MTDRPQITQEDSENLIEHATLSWDAELGNYNRFANRGKLILVSTTALLGFISAAALIARPGEGLSEAIPYTDHPDWYRIFFFAYVLGFVLISLSLCNLILASYVFVHHAEEDAGSLPNPVHFGRIGVSWWMTQPTIDTVEERYFLDNCISRIPWKMRWKKNASVKLYPRKSLLKFLQNPKRSGRIPKLLLGGRIACELRIRWQSTLLYWHFRNNKSALIQASDDYKSFIQYTESCDGELTFLPSKDRGPRDMSSLVIAVELLAIARKLNRDLPLNYTELLVERIQKLIKGKHAGKKCPNETTELSEGDSARVYFDHIAWSNDPDKDKMIDMMHPPQMVKSSSYYLQFAEFFGYEYCGRGTIPDDDRAGNPSDSDQNRVANSTGSGRRLSRLRPETTDVFNEVDWRIFISTYFAAQNLRSSNWNLWFRVKRSERYFLRAFWYILVSFLLLATLEGLVRTDMLKMIFKSPACLLSD